MNIHFHFLAPLLLVGLAPTLVAVDGRAVFQATSPSVVLVKTYAPGHIPLKIGSGFFVEPGDALVTNAHVIVGATEVEIVLLGGVTVPVTEVLAIAPDQDLAILSAKGPGLKLSSRKPDVGEPIFALGNPKGLTATFSNGIVSALRNIGDLPVVQITAPISPGSSGGPVLDENGQVLGVAAFGYREGQNLNFAISSNNILALLAQRKPMTLALATYKAEESSKEGALAHGQDRLSVAKFEKNTYGGDSVAIKNSEAFAVYSISLRVLFYEDTRRVKIDALDANIRETTAAIEKNVGRFGSVLYLKAKAIIDSDPDTWSYDDVAVLGSVHTSIQGYANNYLRSKGTDARNTSARGELMRVIVEAKGYIYKRLQDIDLGIDQIEKQAAELRQKLAELKSERKLLDHSPKAEDLLLVDYLDFNLEGFIASGLTKTFNIQSRLGIAKPVIIDYLIADK